jgi:hypothetical protein
VKKKDSDPKRSKKNRNTRPERGVRTEGWKIERQKDNREKRVRETE